MLGMRLPPAKPLGPPTGYCLSAATPFNSSPAPKGKFLTFATGSETYPRTNKSSGLFDSERVVFVLAKGLWQCPSEG